MNRRVFYSTIGTVIFILIQFVYAQVIPVGFAQTVYSTDLSFKPQFPNEDGELWIEISLVVDVDFSSIYVKLEPNGTGTGNQISILDFSDEETVIESWMYTEKFSEDYAEYRAADETEIAGDAGDILLFAQIAVPDDLADWDINTSPTVKVSVKLNDTTYEATSRIGLDTTFGDISGNGEVTSYDGAIVLQWNVGVKNAQTEFLNSRWGKQVADVSGNGTTDEYDTALLLQYEAGTLLVFPAESDEHPAPSLLPAAPVVVTVNAVRVNKTKWVVSLGGKNAADVVSGYFQFWVYNDLARPGKIEAIGLENPMIVSNSYNDALKISWAQAAHVGTDGVLMHVPFETTMPMSRLPVVLVTARFDENRSVLIEHDPATWSVDEWLHRLPQWKFGADVPTKTTLLQNFPNPFNPETWIPFELAEAANAAIEIFNQRGLLVRTVDIGFLWPGSYVSQDTAAYWDGKDAAGRKVASGVYFYRLTNTSAVPKKMVLIK